MPNPNTNKWELPTRLCKISCPNPECGYTLRGSRKWLSIRLPLCPIHNVQMLPARSDVYLDHRRGDNKTLGSTIKGRPRGSKNKPAVASANQDDSIIKLPVSAYVEPEREVVEDLNFGGVL